MAKYIGQTKFKDKKFWNWLMEQKRYDENNEELLKRLLKYKPGKGKGNDRLFSLHRLVEV